MNNECYIEEKCRNPKNKIAQLSSRLVDWVNLYIHFDT